MNERDAERDDRLAEEPGDPPELGGDQPVELAAVQGDRAGHPRTEPDGEAGMSSARAAGVGWHRRDPGVG